jgi:ATP-dependent helicase/nuclease subunit B
MARVSTIPAGVPFVDALAAGLLAEAGGDALALADQLVLLPNRRACRTLRDAFWRAGGGRALALPRIQPIGDLDADDLLLDAESELGLPPAIGDLRRRLLLTRQLARAGHSVDQAARLADNLVELLDELQTECVPFDALEGLVPEIFARHWQKSLAVLKVLVSFWPEMLAGEQAIDPAERRHRILAAIARRWMAAPPAGRIVAAGSTGSIPATRLLLQVIAGLPAGEVVLPGLDHDLDEASWQALTPQHPQHGLRQLLGVLGCSRAQVGIWPGAAADAARQAPRRKLLAAMMRPSVAAPAPDPIAPEAWRGLSLAEHADPAAEAMAITLRLRAALLEAGRTAALITPDRTLARRVAIELRRFGIEIDDSAGMPLERTAPGSFLLLTAKLMVDEVRPVALLAVLKHPLMRAGLAQEEVRRRARALEIACLRGPAIVGGFAGILDELNDLRLAAAERDPEQATALSALRDWLESLARLARPFAELTGAEAPPLALLVRAHLAFAEGLAMVEGSAEALWAREAGEAAAALIKELLAAADPDDRIAPTGYPALLAQLMARRPVRPRRQRHPRLFIWGQLEARLQQTDLVVLAGLNEGIWPSAEEPGPWLNPAMRERLGLPPLERRIGQAAHDLVQAAAGAEVVLSRAEKDIDGSPTVPSRWIVRLKALASQGSLGEEAIWASFAGSLDVESSPARPESQPKPRPPLAARPRKLPVSDIGLWMRNPYALYAKRILGLAPLDPLEADPGAAERGVIIHEVLERFVREHPRTLPADARRRLLDLGATAFSRHRHRPLVRAIWWPRFCQAVDWVLAREAMVRGELDEILAEIKGEHVIDAPLGPFTLTARADRLERRAGGAAVVVDYKTGSLPAKKDLANGRSPQLPLEGAIIAAGGFEAIGPTALHGLEFWRLSGDEDGGKLIELEKSMIDGALEGLERVVRHYDLEDTAYPAAYRPPTARREDYDHLARLGEWPN